MTDAEKLAELRECYDLVLKTARRCTRDMAHAVDNLPVDLQDLFRERLLHYRLILGPTSEYRVKLHLEIERLERELKVQKRQFEDELQREVNHSEQLKKRFPDDPDQVEMPF